MMDWFVGITTTLLAFFIYLAYFFKFNWVRDMRSHKQVISGVYPGSRNRKLGKLPPVYPNGWFALLESSQIKKGQAKHVSALGENFVVFRTEKGVINILDAYCPHLGANMGEGGRVKGECLECPFHGWLFRGDGQCDRIPYAEKVPNIARTRAWKSCEVNHIIFVWYHAECIEPDWQPRPHSHISSGSWGFQGRNEFLISCHIQDIAENGADCAHLSAVHGPAMFLTKHIPWLARHSWTNAVWKPYYSLSSETETETETETQTEMQIKLNGTSTSTTITGYDYGNHLTENSTKKEKYKAGLRMQHDLILLERFKVLGINLSIEQIGPGYVELMIDSTFGPMCILQTVTPMEPLLQRVMHQIFSPPLLAPYAKLVFLGECLMFKRDVEIWNHKKFERQPILVREDRFILAYRRWYSQFYSANSPTYQNTIKTLDW